MTFLAPSAAIVAAVIGLPLLVLLYILKLLRRPVRVSSTRFWAAPHEDTQVNAPFRRFRWSLLFLLHLTILLLAILAIGRPAILSDAPSGDRVVMIVDVSASMSSKDDGVQTRLERARERGKVLAREILRTSGRSVCVVKFGADAVAATGFTNSMSAIREALESAMPTDQEGDLASAIDLASALVGSDEAAPSATILLLSDGSFPAAGKPLKAPCPIVLERVGPKGSVPVNFGITAFAARRDATDPARLSLFAQVVMSDAPPPTPTIPFTVAVDGKPVLERTLPVAEIPEGGGIRRMTVPLTLTMARGGVLTFLLSNPDALAADNSVSVVVPEPRSPRVVLVQPRGPTDKGATASDWLLSDVIEELRPASLVRMSASDFANAPPSAQECDLLILDRTDTRRLPPIPSLSFGSGSGLPGVEERTLEEKVTTPIVVWKRDHPALSGLSLDSLLVEQGSRFEWDAERKVTELVTGRGGAIVVAGLDGRVRRIAATFALGASNWPLLPEFPAFVASSVDYLTMRGEGSAGRAIRTNQALRLIPQRPGEVVASGPEELRAVAQGEDEVSLGVPSRVGVFTVTGAEQALAAVNLTSEVESLLASPQGILVGQVTLAGAAPGQSMRPAWPWIVMVLAALLVVEWFVFGVRTGA